jgi:hypothetical protein
MLLKLVSIPIGVWRSMGSAYTRQPDRSLLDVQIHEVVDDTTLQVILDQVDDALFANIQDLQIRQVTLVLANCLVDLLVVANTVAEVLGCLLGVLALIVGGCGLDLEDIAHNQVLIIALAFDKKGLNAFGVATILDPSTALLRGVGRIQDGNDSTCLEPGNHIRDSCLGCCAAHPLPLDIVGIKEVCSRLRSILSTIIAHIEDLRID